MQGRIQTGSDRTSVLLLVTRQQSPVYAHVRTTQGFVWLLLIIVNHSIIITVAQHGTMRYVGDSAYYVT